MKRNLGRIFSGALVAIVLVCLLSACSFGGGQEESTVYEYPGLRYNTVYKLDSILNDKDGLKPITDTQIKRYFILHSNGTGEYYYSDADFPHTGENAPVSDYTIKFKYGSGTYGPLAASRVERITCTFDSVSYGPLNKAVVVKEDWRADLLYYGRIENGTYKGWVFDITESPKWFVYYHTENV